MLKFIPILTLVGLLACVTPAEAQIYAWRDSHGVLVLSDRPLDPDARSFAVARTATVRTTRAVAIGAGNRYDDLIERHSAANQIRPDLVKAVIQVESGYNRYAQSRKGAMGLMQLMPSTAAQLGVRDAYDPAQNIRAGVAYLRRLLDRYADNEELALAAYNAGPEAVEQHGSRIPPYRETRNYVKRVKGITALSAVSSVSAVSTERAIYKTIEIINGRPLPRYSDTKPASGGYEIVARAR